MKRLILAGAGHAHAQVLLGWARDPVPGVELLVVSPQALAPYSGMVPGWLAGSYAYEDIVIDFPALCRAAGARWVEGELEGLDAPGQRLRLLSGEELDYDLLSLNVGSTLTPPQAGDGPAPRVLTMRPVSHLRAAYEALLADWVAGSDEPFQLTAVGGGAAGFESLLAVQARLRALRPNRPIQARLVTRSPVLLPSLSGAARRAAHAALARAGVTLHLGTAWNESLARSSDCVLWATGAEAHPWQRDPSRRGALSVSDSGFIRIDEQLRSVSHPEVFAVGDCAEWAAPLPKAGVYAVRMGPVLAHNLRAALGQAPAQSYRPQRQHLVLLATGDGRAIASRGALGAQGRWVWRWKDHIDRQFVNRFA